MEKEVGKGLDGKGSRRGFGWKSKRVQLNMEE